MHVGDESKCEQFCEILINTHIYSQTPAHEDKDTARQELFEYSIGIVMLTFALIASAYLGITQERLYAKHGKHPREALFFVVR